ncbi:hypothetical protein NIES73_24050 [Sphaerospermopsis kisseleviana NIES-73]|nr:hypothetical protein NIES73_24050 [Sphaerospermopsis kisseleviana NIES-73]
MYDNRIAVLPCQHTYTLVKTNSLVKELVSESAANSLQLANAIRLGNIAQALEFGDSEALLQAVRLINCNEPAFTHMLYSLLLVLQE